MFDAVNVDIYPAHPKTMDKHVKTADKDLKDVKLSSTSKGTHTLTRGSTGSNTKPGTPKSPPPSALNGVNSMATVSGVVQSVSANTIVVRTFTGAAQTVTVTSSTTFRDSRGQAIRSDIVRGERVRAYGTESAGGGLTASVVVIDSGSTVGQPVVWSHPQNETIAYAHCVGPGRARAHFAPLQRLDPSPPLSDP